MPVCFRAALRYGACPARAPCRPSSFAKAPHAYSLAGSRPRRCSPRSQRSALATPGFSRSTTGKMTHGRAGHWLALTRNSSALRASRSFPCLAIDDTSRWLPAIDVALLKTPLALSHSGGSKKIGPRCVAGARRREQGSIAGLWVCGHPVTSFDRRGPRPRTKTDAVALDTFSAAPLIGHDDAAQVLGIKPRRQRRRTRQVAKQDRELAALRSCRARWKRSRSR
jgi:hypothetical protein